MDIKKYVDEFSNLNRYYNLKMGTEATHNLLKGDESYSLRKQYGYGNSETLAMCIEDSVKSYTRNKDNAIEVYKSLILFLKKKGVVVEVDFPPINISNSFERLMYISKYLQNPKNNISDLKDVLWISEKTLDDDIKKLLGKDDDPIQVCGKKYIIEDTERGRDKIVFSSTAHPLFLTYNITQVLTILKGLKEMSKDKKYEAYAYYAAASIWEQLSDYAKKRIEYVLKNFLSEDFGWYKGLETINDNSFQSEYRCSIGKDVVLDCLKNGKKCFISYLKGDKEIIYSDCKIIQCYEKTLKIKHDKEEIEINNDCIIKVSYILEDLI